MTPKAYLHVHLMEVFLLLPLLLRLLLRFLLPPPPLLDNPEAKNTSMSLGIWTRGKRKRIFDIFRHIDFADWVTFNRDIRPTIQRNSGISTRTERSNRMPPYRTVLPRNWLFLTSIQYIFLLIWLSLSLSSLVLFSVLSFLRLTGASLLAVRRLACSFVGGC